MPQCRDAPDLVGRGPRPRLRLERDADDRADGGASPPQARPRYAEAPAADLLSAEQLDELVAPIALYPDELLSIVIAGSTQPIQIVQAARFLDAHKKNPKLEPNADWDPAVLSLLNYPEVVDKLNGDLDWTSRLGDAVNNQQDDVMEAVQQVRARAQAAGNLKSTDQVVVEQQQQVIVVRSADPEVVYVPSYNPQVIYAPSPAPVVTYAPRPCYWCPAATFGISMATGFAMGMTTAWMFDWHHHSIGWGPGWGGGWGAAASTSTATSTSTAATSTSTTTTPGRTRTRTRARDRAGRGARTARAPAIGPAAAATGLVWVAAIGPVAAAIARARAAGIAPAAVGTVPGWAAGAAPAPAAAVGRRRARRSGRPPAAARLARRRDLPRGPAGRATSGRRRPSAATTAAATP